MNQLKSNRARTCRTTLQCKSSNSKHFNRANTKHYFRTYSKETTTCPTIIIITKTSRTTCKRQWTVAISSYWWILTFQMVVVVRAKIQSPIFTSNSWYSSIWHSSISSTRYSNCPSSKVLAVVYSAMATSKSSFFNSKIKWKKIKRTSHSLISRLISFNIQSSLLFSKVYFWTKISTMVLTKPRWRCLIKTAARNINLTRMETVQQLSGSVKGTTRILSSVKSQMHWLQIHTASSIMREISPHLLYKCQMGKIQERSLGSEASVSVEKVQRTFSNRDKVSH